MFPSQSIKLKQYGEIYCVHCTGLSQIVVHVIYTLLHLLCNEVTSELALPIVGQMKTDMCKIWDRNCNTVLEFHTQSDHQTQSDDTDTDWWSQSDDITVWWHRSLMITVGWHQTQSDDRFVRETRVTVLQFLSWINISLCMYLHRALLRLCETFYILVCLCVKFVYLLIQSSVRVTFDCPLADCKSCVCLFRLSVRAPDLKELIITWDGLPWW